MSLSSRFAVAAGILLVVTLLAGCAPKKSFPDKRYYVLDASRPRGASSPAKDVVLSVRRLRVSPRYERKGLVYRTGELNYESDFYNEFLISPSAILTQEVRQWMEASHLFRNVVASASHMAVSYILEGNVTALYGDYRDAGSPKAVLEMQFFLISDISVETEVAFQRDYREEVPLKETSPEALVDGWNEALGQILAALEQDLRAVSLSSG